MGEMRVLVSLGSMLLLVMFFILLGGLINESSKIKSSDEKNDKRTSPNNHLSDSEKPVKPLDTKSTQTSDESLTYDEDRISYEEPIDIAETLLDVEIDFPIIGNELAYMVSAPEIVYENAISVKDFLKSDLFNAPIFECRVRDSERAFTSLIISYVVCFLPISRRMKSEKITSDGKCLDMTLGEVFTALYSKICENSLSAWAENCKKNSAEIFCKLNPDGLSKEKLSQHLADFIIYMSFKRDLFDKDLFNTIENDLLTYTRMGHIKNIEAYAPSRMVEMKKSWPYHVMYTNRKVSVIEYAKLVFLAFIGFGN